MESPCVYCVHANEGAIVRPAARLATVFTAALVALLLGVQLHPGEQASVLAETVFDGIYLSVSALDANHTTHYEVHFDDAAREAQRASYTYSWALDLPSGDDCLTNAPALAVSAAEPWKASWAHPNCSHAAGERIRVVVQQGDHVTMEGAATGAQTVRPTSIPTPRATATPIRTPTRTPTPLVPTGPTATATPFGPQSWVFANSDADLAEFQALLEKCVRESPAFRDLAARVRDSGKVRIDVGRGQDGVAVDQFHGGGRNEIDLNDLNQTFFPNPVRDANGKYDLTRPPMPRTWAGTICEKLAHILGEALNAGTKTGSEAGLESSHRAGIQEQNKVRHDYGQGGSAEPDARTATWDREKGRVTTSYGGSFSEDMSFSGSRLTGVTYR
jgi:hypothetical protein